MSTDFQLVADTPAVKTLAADAKTAAHDALNHLADGIDAALGGAAVSEKTLAPDAVAAFEAALEEFVPSGVRSWVQAALNTLPVNTALVDLDAQAAAVLAIAKARVDSARNVV